MKRLAVLISVLFIAVSLSGCATVNRGITDHFRIDSVPQGAKATTSIETAKSKAARKKNPKLQPEYHSCKPTPCAIPLYRRSEFVVTLEHEDYETAKMFITNSAASGSFTANMAATTAVTTGTAAAGAATGAAIATSLSAITPTILGGVVGGSASIFTFGLVPVETGVSAGVSFFSSAGSATTTSSSAAASSALPAALIVTGGMLVTDAITGANVNLYPNPVVLKMAPKGTPVKVDPNVAEFQKILSAEEHVNLNCPPIKKYHPSQIIELSENCIAAKEKLKRARNTRKQFQKARKEQLQKEREASKE